MDTIHFGFMCFNELKKNQSHFFIVTHLGFSSAYFNIYLAPIVSNIVIALVTHSEKETQTLPSPGGEDKQINR